MVVLRMSVECVIGLLSGGGLFCDIGVEVCGLF